MSGEIDLGPSRRLTHHLGYDGNGRWGNQAIGSDDFDTPQLMLASTVPYGQQPFWRPGHRLRAGGFDYIIAPAGASDHHLITVGGVKLYVVLRDPTSIPFDAFGPAKNGYAAASMTPAPDMATIVDDIPKLNLALQLARGGEVRLSPGFYGQDTPLVIPANTKLNGGMFGAAICAKDGFVGWQCETENYDAAYANAQADANGDFHPLVPKRPSVVGVIFDGAHQSYNRSFIRRQEATAGGGGIRVYAIQFELNVCIFNQPGIGLDTYSRGGNGPTPLRVNRTKQAQMHVLIDQTAGEGWRHRGPGDVVAGVVYQCNAGARLVGQAAGQEDTGKKPSAIYGATNGGYTDGIVFDGAAVEMMFCHSWGNRAGRGIVQYGGRLLAPLIIAENNHFGGVRFEGGTGVIGILKAHKNCAWVEDFIGAPSVYDASANVYHNSGQTGTETNSHVIGQIQIEDNNALGTLRGGIAHGLRLGPNSRHLIVSAIHVSKRGVIPGHGVMIDAGAAFYDIGGIRVHDAIGDTGGGVMSAAVHRAGGGMGRIRGQSVNCSVGYRNAGPTTNLTLEHVDFLVQANAGQLVFDGFARSHAGQRWDIRGTVDGAYVDLARNGGTLTIATADAAGATIAPTHNRHLLTCQADGNYVVTNITAPGWARPGDRFQFSTVTGARDVTFTPTTGNLRCNAGANRVLDTPADRIEFEFDGTNFVEISFANNV